MGRANAQRGILAWEIGKLQMKSEVNTAVPPGNCTVAVQDAESGDAAGRVHLNAAHYF